MNNTLTAQKIAESLIVIDTSTPAGIDEARQWLLEWAHRHNLATADFSDTKALLIEINPEAKFHFCFVSHLDVAEADGWEKAFQPEVQDGFLVGRGSVNNKGPLAVSLAVLLACQDNPQFKDIHLTCLVVMDEEKDNQDIYQVLKDERFKPTFCLVPDGGTHTQIDVGQKGIIRCEVSLTLEGGHSAFEQSKKSASLSLLALIQTLQKKAQSLAHSVEFSPTFINVSSFVSDTVPYGLPNQAAAHLEIQFPLPQTSNQWLDILKEEQAKMSGCDVTVHWVSEPHIFKDTKMLSLFESLPGIKCITTGGNNLAKDLCLAGIPAVSHCPIEEYVAHSKNEKIGLVDLEKGVELYLKIIRLVSTGVL